MGTHQRRKGTEAERELVRLLRDELGDDGITRNLEQTREGGGDIRVPPFVIEAKRAKAARIREWWAQAVAQAGTSEHPALAYRLDRQPWRVRVPLAAMTDAAGSPEALDWTAEMSVQAFAAVVRERMGDLCTGPHT